MLKSIEALTQGEMRTEFVHRARTGSLWSVADSSMSTFDASLRRIDGSSTTRPISFRKSSKSRRRAYGLLPLLNSCITKGADITDNLGVRMHDMPMRRFLQLDRDPSDVAAWHVD
jgi:hypothetical protein